MTLEEFVKILESTGLPVAENCFPEGHAPQLPYICYLTEGNENFAADGVVYYSTIKIRVELYTKRKDISVEKVVEQALSSFYWEKDEEYIESEKCHLTNYEGEI